ncbi:MAG: cell division protein FtsZ [Candidatus Latescibacterota bacterium]|nr:cell division protein FtsZ [Candidatus Latescibacterota bacterium]
MPITMVDNERQARIKVIGVGGGGGNAINRMIQSGMHGVEFIAINTDAQALETSSADFSLCIGDSVTRGLGAGADPEVGRQAVEEDREKVSERLQDADLVFITAGMGGGTGTGAAPVVAAIAREQGALAVGIVTEPFMMEGSPRMNNARTGIEELQGHVDTLITIKNQRLLTICGRETTLKDAFFKADEVLLQATRGIADLITIPGMINLDFNDVRTVISKGGDAIMGVGAHSGENRAVEAARKAINSPLLEDVSISGAKGVLINIAADSNLTLFEVNEAMSLIHEATGPEATIIFGTVIDDGLEGDIRVTVIATGFNHSKDNTIPFRSGEQEKALQAISVDQPVAETPALLDGLGLPAGSPLDTPVYLSNGNGAASRQGNGNGNEVAPQQGQGAAAADNLDVPTFLRRKMNA